MTPLTSIIYLFVEGGYSSEGIGVMKSEKFFMLFGAWKRWPARLFLSSASTPECHGFGHTTRGSGITLQMTLFYYFCS